MNEFNQYLCQEEGNEAAKQSPATEEKKTAVMNTKLTQIRSAIGNDNKMSVIRKVNIIRS